jgi:hypothetical protein
MDIDTNDDKKPKKCTSVRDYILSNDLTVESLDLANLEMSKLVELMTEVSNLQSKLAQASCLINEHIAKKY